MTVTTTFKFNWSTISKFNNCLDLNHPPSFLNSLRRLWTIIPVSGPACNLQLKTVECKETDGSWVCFCSSVKLRAADFWTRFCISPLSYLLFLILHPIYCRRPCISWLWRLLPMFCCWAGTRSVVRQLLKKKKKTDSEKVHNSSSRLNIMTCIWTIRQELLQKS